MVSRIFHLAIAGDFKYRPAAQSVFVIYIQRILFSITSNKIELSIFFGRMLAVDC